MTNEKTLKKQEELFAKDCKLINLKYEYTGYIGQEKWAIVSELSEQELFEKYPNVAALADAPVEDIEAIVKPCGLGHSKARDISACMKVLRDEYGGHVPDDFNALLKLPGVGRKSANLIMGDVFGKPAIVTDTHCIRLVNRIGLVEGIKDPKRVEMALWKLIPPEEGSDFCHRLVYHGREVCTARTKPYCDKCCLQDICAKAGVE